MKRILFLSMLFLSLNTMAQTGTNIFSYGTNGEVLPVNTFIKNGIMTWENDTLLPYKTSIVTSLNKAYSYKVVLEVVDQSGFQDSVFNSIKIVNAQTNEALLTLQNEDLWRNTKLWSDGAVDNDYISVPLSDKAIALIFIGWCYDITPSLTTIVVLKDGKATLVFNKNCNSLDYQQTSSTFSVTYAEIIQEMDGNEHLIPSDKDLKKFKIWKEGEMLKYTALN